MANLQLNQLGTAVPATLAIQKEVVACMETEAGFILLQRQAKMYISSSMVPKAYQGQEGLANCVIALDMANRLHMSPLMVMQNLYIVYGTPSWSSKFLIATFNQCGRFSAINYKMTGEKGKDNWGCIAYAKEKETGETIYSPEITIEIAKKEGWYGKNGSKWQTMPELMLRYRAASLLIRTYAPEISMGLSTEEEIYDMQEDNQGNYTVTEVKNAYVPPAKIVEENKVKEIPAPKKTTAKKEPVQVEEVAEEQPASPFRTYLNGLTPEEKAKEEKEFAESEQKRKQQAKFIDNDVDDDDFYKNSK